MQYYVGPIEDSEQLIKDLYVSLRDKLIFWSTITKQTPQARMGYIGQHLVSIVTGFPGSRSGARGHDINHPDGRHSEIKTCYRVDQLGSCNNCGSRVASIETKCPDCNNTNIDRKDDSKWLVSIRNDQEMNTLFHPKFYYLVLFDFADITSAEEINARIWTVDPKDPGFAMCMVDYYFNIRSRSASSAPFNLWPFQLKFQLMSPILIYHSIISNDGNINTIIFPEFRGETQQEKVNPLHSYSQSTILSKNAIKRLYIQFGLLYRNSVSKRESLTTLEEFRIQNNISNGQLIESLSHAIYYNRIREYFEWLPFDVG